MKAFGHAVLYIILSFGISFWLVLIWRGVLRPMFRRWQFKRGDGALKRLTDHTDYLHELFGPSVSIRSLTKNDGTYEIYLQCPKCERENRLVKGFVGAVCGQCKSPFLRPVVSTAQAEQRPN